MKTNNKNEKDNLPEDMSYAPSEDIYNNSKEEQDIDPEDISKTKTLIETDTDGKRNEKGFLQDVSGRDLDIPGSELDDEAENNGNEDEENNHYSLGGDAHNDLEEDRGE
jgi:hypothetical protein